MQTTRLLIDGIETGERLRPLDQSRVDALVTSIKELGLRTPITVMSRADGDDTRMILVAGMHRLAALRQIGEEAVDCVVMDDDEVGAQLWEIAENLHRSDLTKEQRDEHIRRYASLLSARKTTQSASFSVGGNGGPGRGNKGIASQVAAETGVSKDTVRRALNPDRVAAERARSKLDADLRVRAAKSLAELIAEYLPPDAWDHFKSNLAVTTSKDLLTEFTNITGQSIMGRAAE